MANPIDKLKKIKGRSWTEIRTRGEQAFSVYREQIGLSGNLLSDEEFDDLLDKSQFNNQNVTAAVLLEKFFQNSEISFFQSFRDRDETLRVFRHNFGERSAHLFIEKADKIVGGKFDLLGYENLDFGTPVDWHLEPLSGKRSTKKHWKQFDDVSTDETGDRKIVWELNRQQYFFTLGIAFWLTKNERYAKTFTSHLASWMNENPPGVGVNWSSSLEAAFRVVSWLWAFHFFRDSASLTPELFRAALKFLFLHGTHIEKYLSTYYSPNTHLTGEALALYYLGTQLKFFKHSGRWRKKGATLLLGELDRQILPDGVYFEQSTWYQRYTTDFYTHFQILRNLNGDEKDDAAREKLDGKLQSLLDFSMATTRPDGTTALVGDDDGGTSLPHSNAAPDDFRAVLSTGAALFGRGDYKSVAGEFAAETLWLLGADAAQTFENLPEHAPAKNSFAFRDGGYFVMRDGWTETDNYMLVDCGALGALSAGHGHADALAVNAAIGGRTVLVDAGTYTYHESEKARNRFRRSEAHNTLTIGGKSQSEPGGKFGWQTKAQATLDRWLADDRFDFFAGAHDGYRRLADAATHERDILFLKNDYWIMRDAVKTRGAYDYALNFQFSPETNPSIENAGSGNSCVGEKSAFAVGFRLFTFGDNGGWQREESRISPNFGKSVSAPSLKFKSHGAGTQEFFSFLLPWENGFDAPDVFETSVVGARAFVIKYRGYTDVFVFSDGAQIVRTEFFNANFEFVWARLGGADELPEEFVLIGGSHFSIGSREIVNHPQALDFAVARRLGNRLNVRTSENVFSLSLSKKNR